MTEEPTHPISDHAGKEDAIGRDSKEALDRLIYGALAMSVVRSLSEDANPAAVMTDVDREAFQAMGTPEEVARRVYERIQRKVPARSEAHLKTCASDQDVAETILSNPQTAANPDREFEELLSHHSDCQQVESFEWGLRFRKERIIGRGGQGVVYRINCEDDFVGSRALKILSPERYYDAPSYRQDMERMRSVAAAVHQISHDNLLYVERFEPHHGIYLMFMRLVDGFNLEQLLNPELVGSLQGCVHLNRWKDHLNEVVFVPRSDGQWGLAPGVAVNIIQKCLRGLSALHDKEIVHCDIKPSNIMLDCYGSIRLIDIGSAFQLDSPPRQHAWTPFYAPPEVLQNDQWTKQGDLASLGYVLVELLSGQPDSMGPVGNLSSPQMLGPETRSKLMESKRQLPDRLEQLIPAKAGKSKNLKELCRKLIDPDPTNRFASAEEAFDWTVKFQAELVGANLSMPWVTVIKDLVTDVKKVIGSADIRG